MNHQEAQFVATVLDTLDRWQRLGWVVSAEYVTDGGHAPALVHDGNLVALLGYDDNRSQVIEVQA